MDVEGALVERDLELGSIAASLDAALDGAGALVLVDGDPGCGTSSLIAAARRGARERGMIVGEARGSEASVLVPLGIVRALFAGALNATGEEHRAWALAAVAEPVRTWLTEAGSADPSEAEAIEALGELAGRIARRSPALIAVDDLQWSDPASVRVLLALVPWLVELTLVLLVGMQADGPSEADHASSRLIGRAEARVVRPRPLSADGVAILLSRRFGSNAAASIAWPCHELTAGNPWLLAAVLDRLEELGPNPTRVEVAGLAESVPEPLVRRARGKLSHMSDSERALAEALAVLGGSTELGVAAALARLDPVDAAASADALAGRALISPGEPLAFRQPLLAAAVAVQIPAFARTRLHSGARELLEEGGAAPERIAPHLLGVEPSADARVVATLRAAAAEASAAGEHERAVAFLRRALAEPPEDALRRSVVAELALAEGAAGEVTAVDRLLEALAKPAADVDRGRLHVTLGRLHLARNEYAEAARAAERGLDELEPGDPHAEPLLAVQQIASGLHPPLQPAAMRRARPLIEAAFAGDLPDDPGLCAWLAASLGALGGPIRVVRELVDRALRASPLVDESHHSIYSYVRVGLLNIDDVDRAEETAEAAMIRAAELGHRLAHDLAQLGRGLARFRAGRLDEALADAEAALALRDAGWTVELAYNAALLVAIRVEKGDLVAAREAVAIGHEHAAPGTLESAHMMHAQAMVEMEDGSTDAALASLLAAGEVLAGLGLREMSPVVLAWASAAAIAAGEVGDRKLALELTSDELERARRTELPGLHGVALRALALVGEDERRAGRLEEAVVALERSPARLEHARALVDLGVAIREEGRRESAREPLAAGLEVADQCGATILATRALDELRLAGAKPRRSARTGPDSLTASERRVAVLAARGRTNPEIAEELVISVKTVEGALRRSYRKLGIASRTELGSALDLSRSNP